MRWLAGCAAVLALAVGGQAQAGGEAKPEAACARDADCVKVASGCCNCANGGAAKAINRKTKAAWEREQRKACEGVACMTVISNDPSCADEAKPRCVGGRCTL